MCACVSVCVRVYVCVYICLSVYKDLRGDPRLMALVIDDELRIENINRLWEDFNRALSDKNASVNDRLARLTLTCLFFSFVFSHLLVVELVSSERRLCLADA